MVIDRQKRALAPTLGGILSIPALFAFDQPQFKVQFADTPVIATNPYIPLDLSGFTLDVDFGPQPKGSAGSGGGGSLTVSHGNAFDANNKWFLCNPLDLSQATVLALLNNLSQVSTFLEFTLMQAGQPQFHLQLQPQLFAVLDTGVVANVPPPGPTYPTTQDVRGSFLSKGPTTGDSKIWLSLDGTKAAFQYLDNNGVMQFDPIPVPPTPLY